MSFVDSHVHYIEEDPLEYVETLLRRMDEHGIEKAVLFGVQGHPLCSDAGVWHIHEKYPGRFVAFACSVRCERESDLQVFMDYVDSDARWQGVGEIYVDLGPHDGVQRVRYRDGTEHLFQPYCPADKEKNRVYQDLLEFCGARNLPVLVHCVSVATMRSLLACHPNTNVIWGHADWSLPTRQVIAMLTEYRNLLCEIGTQLRFSAQRLLTGGAEPWESQLLEGWKQGARAHPQRILWGSDIFAWAALDRDAYGQFVDIWNLFSDGLSVEARRRIGQKNILELVEGRQKSARQGAALGR